MRTKLGPRSGTSDLPAALFDAEGDILVAREDIGRHNAVDKVVGSYVLAGAAAVDWEDMAIGPTSEGGSYLYLADIGDNADRRSWSRGQWWHGDGCRN